MDIAVLILILVLGGFAAGYSFRSYIGEEIKKIGADISAEIAKAKAAEQKIVGEIKEKI